MKSSLSTVTPLKLEDLRVNSEKKLLEPMLLK
jgi:hypothetical protein